MENPSDREVKIKSLVSCYKYCNSRSLSSSSDEKPRSELANSCPFPVLRRSVSRRGKMGGGGAANEFGPIKETVLALLELLVEPLLPSPSSIAKAPSPAQQESVAKQVQAVVILYDYYHRKCNPELEFLDHVSLGKLAVNLKPGLLPYMKVVQKDDANEFSLMDKKIMEACDISKSLNTSKAEFKEWPIAKVAVFLVDSSKECCFLVHSASTQGVWSLIEKDWGLHLGPEGMVEEMTGIKKKKITKKPLKESRNADEIALRQLAFAAVKVACGCIKSDLRILESHTVYSLSKAKTAARFYIMQCKQTKQEDNFVPIKDVLDSLQGPLVTKEACGWSTTSVVEYFHLLPYAEILTDWPSRESTMEASPEEAAEQENIGEPPTEYNGGDNEGEQIQIVTFIPDEEAEPCKMPQEEDIESGKCNQMVAENTSPKINSGKEKCIRNKAEPDKIPQEEDIESGKCNQMMAENPLPKINAGKEKCIRNKAAPDNALVIYGQEFEETPSRILRSGQKSEYMKETGRTEEPVVYKKRKNLPKRDKACNYSVCKSNKVGPECSTQKDIQNSASCLSNNMEVDEHVSSADCSIDGKNKSSSGEDRVTNEMKTMVLQKNITSLTRVVSKEEIVSTLQNDPEQKGENNALVHFGSNARKPEKLHKAIPEVALKNGTSCQDAVLDNALVLIDSNARKLERVHKAISEAAITTLHKKREMLSYQLRNIEDEIALCDRNIQAILDGSEYDLGAKLDSMLDGCNIINSSNGVSADERMYPPSQDQNARKCLKRKGLCEAILTLKSPCKELDEICCENCWALPTYSISTSNGAFEAAVTVKGVDFKCSSKGVSCSNPQGARESAASSVLIKMRGLAPAS